MAQNSNLSPETLNAMLKMAGSKLGMSPEQLKSTLTDPKKADALLCQLGLKKPAQDNRQSIEELLNQNPRAKKMLNDLLGGKG